MTRDEKIINKRYSKSILKDKYSIIQKGTFQKCKNEVVLENLTI